MSRKILLGILVKVSARLHKEKMKLFVIKLKVSSCSWSSTET